MKDGTNGYPVEIAPQEYDVEAERIQQALQLGYDPDLFTTSCIGSGVMYPDLWQVIKRYILRGDEYYQSGGLSILASTAWHMPLSEAASVLEEYFAKHGGCPLYSDGRGGINLTALSAVYAVATTYGWDGTDLEQRKVRMLTLLERCRDVLAEEGSADMRSVEETIEAVRGNKPNFEPRYPEQMGDFPYVQEDDDPSRGGYLQGEAVLLGANPPGKTAIVANESQGISRDDAEAMINQAVAAFKQELPQVSLTQMDLITVKHGYDMLERNIAGMERLYAERFSGLEKRFEDRFADLRGERQEQLERSQVRFGKWGLIVAIITLVISTGITILFQLFFA